MDLFLFAAFYGVTFALTQTSLLQRPRLLLARIKFFRDLLSCSYCTGFHVGWVLYLGLNGSWNIHEGLKWAFASAAISYVVDLVTERLELENGHLRDKLQ